MLINRHYKKNSILINIVVTPWVFLLLLTFLVHGLVLINNGIYWDGVLIYAFQKSHNTAMLREWFSEAGASPVYYLHRFLWLFNSQLIYNIIGFFSVYCTGFLAYKIARLYRNIPQTTAILIGAITITFPGSMLTFFRVLTPGYICMVLFMLASYCGLIAISFKNKLTSITLRIISLILFFASFALQSFLVYFAIFFICLYIASCNKNKRNLISPSCLLKFCVHYFDFLILPFVFKFLTSVYFKTAGAYKDYNIIDINKLKLHFLDWYSQSLNQGVYFYFKDIFNPWVLISIIAISVIFIAWHYIYKRPLNTKPIQLKIHLVLTALGIIAVLLAIFPYVIVGKPITPQIDFLSSRCALLIPLSMSLIIAGIIGLTIRYKYTKTITILLTAFLLFTFTKTWWQNYLSLSAMSASQKAAIKFVKTHPQFVKYRICWLNLKKLPSILLPNYGTYAQSNMWNNYQPKNSKIIIIHKTAPPLGIICSQYNQTRFNFPDADLKGPQADLILSSKYTNKDILKINLRYIYYRFFNKKKLDAFLENIINIQVTPSASKINLTLLCYNYTAHKIITKLK